ncbi:hypothetical protein BOTBODRAFT_178053 [Botryobasidium botryosum FD-172 SS1]|uniref:Uncharacterized protein n=1 Tax=Botryobasidium botryosum (strain FD-172 SS1) TaxID=930990 RepID=A0A067MFA9_BOTB1|nr:hypothetical protein BOTBODRAFT_178053 [Botryobasidium botryosum FD-172 SS1]
MDDAFTEYNNNGASGNDPIAAIPTDLVLPPPEEDESPSADIYRPPSGGGGENSAAADTMFICGQKSLKRLHPESMIDLERYTKVPRRMGELMTYALLLEVRDALHVDGASNPISMWKITAGSGSSCVNLFFTVCASLTRPYAQETVKTQRFGVPCGLENDGERWKEVESECKSVITGLKSGIKQAIAITLGSKATAKKVGKLVPAAPDIVSLGEAIIHGTDLKLTVRHLARIAFLRKVLAEKATTGEDSYWIEVDKQLHDIREVYKGDRKAESYKFKSIFDEDLVKYGNPSGRLGVQPDELSAWQTAAEGALA